MKKTWYIGLCAIVALLLMLSCAVAETAPLSLLENMENFYCEKVFVTGDTAYLIGSSYNDGLDTYALYRWKEGETEPTLVADKLIRAYSGYTMDDLTFSLTGKDDLDLDLEHAVTFFFSDGQRLMAYNGANDLFFELVVGEDGVSFQNMATLLDKTPFMHVEEDFSFFTDPYDTLTIGDTLLCLVSDYQPPEYVEIMKFISIDLKTGAATISKVENVISLCNYKDGKVLLSMRQKDHAKEFYDTDKGRYYPLELAQYDPQTDTAEKIAMFDGNTYRPDWTWSDALQAPVWVENSRVKAYLDLSEIKQVGYMPSPYVSSLGLMGNTILASSGSGVYVRDVSRDFRSDVYLTAYDVYGEGAQKFAKLYPNVPVYSNEEWYSDMESIAQAMVTGSDRLDVLRMTISYSAFETMLRKGYCADLSASDAIMDAVSRMYPVFQNAVKNKDGKICAVPVSAYSTGWRANRSVMEEVGLTEDDIPTSYVELCEFVSRWNEEYADTYDMYTVFSTSGSDYVKNNLFNISLTEYINYCKAQNGSIRFDTPIFRQLVAAIEGMEVDGVLPSWEEGGDGIWRESLFDYGYSVVGNFSNNDTYSIEMPLSLTPDTPVINTAEVSVIFINPKTQHMDMALKYVECILDGLEDDTKIILFSDITEPVLNDYYEEGIQNIEANIAQLEEMLKTADPSEKKELETSLEYSTQWLEEYKTYYRYNISPEAMAHYQQDIVPTIAVGSRTFLNDTKDNANSELNTLIRRYLDKQIKLDQFIREADQKLMMMEMEDQ